MSANHDYTRYYNHFHRQDRWQRQTSKRSYFPYIRSLDIPKSARILDIGCGQGFFVEAMKDLGYSDVSGVDTSSEQIRIASSNVADCFHIEDLQSWAKSGVTYDFIFLFDVLEHVPINDQVEFLTCVKGCLAQNGMLFVRVPNANAAFASRFRWGDWTHHCSFTEHSIDYVLFAAGFSNIKVLEDHFGRLPIWVPRPSLASILRWIARAFRRLVAMGELGTQVGWTIPLTPNLVAKVAPDTSSCLRSTPID